MDMIIESTATGYGGNHIARDNPGSGGDCHSSENDPFSLVGPPGSDVDQERDDGEKPRLRFPKVLYTLCLEC